MGASAIGMDVPHVLRAGDLLSVQATAEEDNLALVVTIDSDDGRRIGPELLTPLGGRAYRACFEALPPGVYEITIAAAAQTPAIDPVSDVTVISDAATEK